MPHLPHLVPLSSFFMPLLFPTLSCLLSQVPSCLYLPISLCLRLSMTPSPSLCILILCLHPSITISFPSGCPLRPFHMEPLLCPSCCSPHVLASCQNPFVLYSISSPLHGVLVLLLLGHSCSVRMRVSQLGLNSLRASSQAWLFKSGPGLHCVSLGAGWGAIMGQEMNQVRASLLRYPK